jgi:hypothetical protein
LAANAISAKHTEEAAIIRRGRRIGLESIVYTAHSTNCGVSFEANIQASASSGQFNNATAATHPQRVVTYLP